MKINGVNDVMLAKLLISCYMAKELDLGFMLCAKYNACQYFFYWE